MKSEISSSQTQIANQSSVEQAGQQKWEEAGENLAQLLLVWLNRLQQIYQEHKKTIIRTGLVLALVPFLAILFTVLAVINLIPFVAPALKLIGFGVTIWFIYRYLLLAAKRQELLQKVQVLKVRILGQEA